MRRAAFWLLLLLSGCGTIQPVDHELSASHCEAVSGTISVFELASDVFGSIPVSIYTPPCYDSSDAHYPALYLLHGAGGTHNTWLTLGANEVADELLSEGQIEPLIIVAPSVPNFAQSAEFSQFVTAQLIPYVDAQYRTSNSPSQRGLAGMSAGGTMSAYVGFEHAPTFGALGVLAISSVQQIDQPLERLRNTSPSKRPAILLDVGDQDGLRGQQQLLSQHLLAGDITHENVVRAGDHSLDYWAKTLPNYLLWFDEQFKRSSQ